MESILETQPSAFAQLLDKLRTKSEEELKLLYTRLLVDDLKEEWKNMTETADFGNCSEDDIISVIQENRYKGQHEQDSN